MPLVSTNAYEFLQRNSTAIAAAMRYDRDYMYSYFGFKTLEKSYLLRCNKKIVERPQDLLMRVAIGIHMSQDASKEENDEAHGWKPPAEPS